MARNEQLIRQLKLLQILERYRYGRSLTELREELVSELGLGSLHQRSVRRDLQALQAAGFDLDAHDSPRGRVWKLGPMFRGSHQLAVSASELIALSLARDLMHPLAGTPFWQALETFWNKVRESLPEPVWRHYQKFRQTISVWGLPAKNYDSQQGILRTLHRSIQEHRVVEIQYQSLGQSKPQQRRIEPYGIVFFTGSLYVVARIAETSDEQPEMRHWKLDRFHAAEALDQWFSADPDFSLERHLSGSIGIFSSAAPQTYRIWISEYAAAWLREDPWQVDQQLQPHPDGGYELSLRAAHDMDVLPRVLALGLDARLLSPESARQRLAEIAQSLAEAYRGSS